MSNRLCLASLLLLVSVGLGVGILSACIGRVC